MTRCGCFGSSRPKYKQHIINLYPTLETDHAEGLNERDIRNAWKPRNVSELTQYATLYPNKLQPMVKYMLKKMKKDIQQDKYRNVAVSMYGMSAIVETNHSDVKTSKTENNNIKHKHAQKKIHQAKQDVLILYDSYVYEALQLNLEHPNPELNAIAAQCLTTMMSYLDDTSDSKKQETFYSPLIKLATQGNQQKETTEEQNLRVKYYALEAITAVIVHGNPQRTSNHLNEIITAILNNIPKDGQYQEDIKDADAEMLSPTTDSPVAVSSSSLGSLAFTCLKQLTTSPAVTSYPALLTPVFNYLHSIGWTSTQCCSSILTVIINESGGRKNNIVADTCLQGLLNYLEQVDELTPASVFAAHIKPDSPSSSSSSLSSAAAQQQTETATVNQSIADVPLSDFPIIQPCLPPIELKIRIVNVSTAVMESIRSTVQNWSTVCEVLLNQLQRALTRKQIEDKSSDVTTGQAPSAIFIESLQSFLTVYISKLSSPNDVLSIIHYIGDCLLKYKLQLKSELQLEYLRLALTASVGFTSWSTILPGSYECGGETFIKTILALLVTESRVERRNICWNILVNVLVPATDLEEEIGSATANSKLDSFLSSLSDNSKPLTSSTLTIQHPSLTLQLQDQKWLASVIYYELSASMTEQDQTIQSLTNQQVQEQKDELLNTGLQNIVKQPAAGVASVDNILACYHILLLLVHSPHTVPSVPFSIQFPVLFSLYHLTCQSYLLPTIHCSHIRTMFVAYLAMITRLLNGEGIRSIKNEIQDYEKTAVKLEEIITHLLSQKGERKEMGQLNFTITTGLTKYTEQHDSQFLYEIPVEQVKSIVAGLIPSSVLESAATPLPVSTVTSSSSNSSAISFLSSYEPFHPSFLMPAPSRLERENSFSIRSYSLSNLLPVTTDIKESPIEESKHSDQIEEKLQNKPLELNDVQLAAGVKQPTMGYEELAEMLAKNTIKNSSEFDSFMNSLGNQFLNLSVSNAIINTNQQATVAANGISHFSSTHPSTTTTVNGDTAPARDSRENSLSFVSSAKLQPVGGSTTNLLSYGSNASVRSNSINPAQLKMNSMRRQVTTDSVMSEADGEEQQNAMIESIPLDIYSQPSEEMNWLPQLDKRKTSQTHSSSILNMQFPQLASFDIYLNTELE